ncbi:MAG: RNA polymerase sigma factor [Ktedonobacteraceae bacterium]
MESIAAREIGWMCELPVEDDRQLVQRIATGDRQALAELYVRYQRPLFHYLLQLTPDYGLAEELLQDTLVAVWKNANSFEQRSSVLTWLFGIARRQAHNTLRQHKISLVDVAALEDMADTEPEPEAFALANIARDELLAAFKQLALVHREVLVLILVQDLSYEETATILAVPIGTVKSRLSNARKSLRTILTVREEAEK